MSVLTDLQHKNANVAHIFQQVLDEEVGPVRTDLKAVEDALSGEVKEQLEHLAAENARLEKEIKALKALANRPGGMTGFDDPNVKAEASKIAFKKALRFGWGTLSPDEKKYVR